MNLGVSLIVPAAFAPSGEPGPPTAGPASPVWPAARFRAPEQHVRADPSEVLATLMRHGACAVLPGGSALWRGQRVRRAWLGNTHPWRRYFNRRLHWHPQSLRELLDFLQGCTYLSDRATRGCEDYWEVPDAFDTRRTGDCEDHAIWAWRCLTDMGVASRLVLGESCGEWHAWVHVFAAGRCWLVETTGKWPGIDRREDNVPWWTGYTPRWSVERRFPKKFETYAHFEEDWRAYLNRFRGPVLEGRDPAAVA